MNYGYKKRIEGNFDEVLNKVRRSLQKKNFAILSQINAKAILKGSFNAKFNNYVIIGPCNPNYASRMLQTEFESGLFLPCNMLVYEDNGVVFVAILKHDLVFGLVDNPKLVSISKEVDRDLKSVIDNL